MVIVAPEPLKRVPSETRFLRPVLTVELGLSGQLPVNGAGTYSRPPLTKMAVNGGVKMYRRGGVKMHQGLGGSLST